jgi:group I intron endonuclease
MEVICGIYKITSPSNKIYIGQSLNIKKRYSKYKNLDCGSQKHLYNSFKKYGFNNHKFEILSQCLPNQLNETEKYYTDLFQTFNTKNGLNLRDGGGSQGKMSKESIEKMRAASIGKKHSLETRKKMSLSSIGKSKTKEHALNISKSKKGRICSEKELQRLKTMNIGKSLPQKTRDKISLALKGRMPKNIEILKKSSFGKTITEETRQRLRDSHKGQIPWNKGKKCTDELKEKYSLARYRYLERKKNVSC